MPIEIKELHVKINVDTDSNRGAPIGSAPGNKELIVAACVEQVMEIIANLKER